MSAEPTFECEDLGPKDATVIRVANAESALHRMEGILEHFQFLAKATSVPKLQRIASAPHLPAVFFFRVLP